MQVQQETPAVYNTTAAREEAIISQALAILEGRLRKPNAFFSEPAASRQFCALKLGDMEREVMAVLFLDCHHGLIEFREMFAGTLTQTSVYPREIARVALALNAGAVILTHNHPSGDTKPSRADEMLTTSLRNSLGMFDIRVLDHIIVAGSQATSMAESGLI